MPGRAPRARHGFGAELRLSGSRAFEGLLAHGTRRNFSGYTVYMERRAEGPPRLGVLVSRRHAAKATERNGIKRCIREAFRLEQARLGSVDILVRPPYDARASSHMLSRLRQIFAELEP